MQIFGSDERKLLYKKHIWNRQVFSKERRIVCLKKGLHFLDGIFFVGQTWNNSKHVLTVSALIKTRAGAMARRDIG